MNKKIAVFLAEGFEEVEAVSIIDVLRRAEFDVTVVSVTEKKEVTSSHQVKIVADELFEGVEYNSIDMIVLPGGIPGAYNLRDHKGLNEQIKTFFDSNKPLAAICAAPLVFGNLGILRNKKATCFPGHEDKLTGADVTGNHVEVDGNIITGKGAGVALKFALQIVEFLKDKESADKLADKMIATR